ncbi:class V chitinase [Penicillium hispanicum]|uniref:class V chitinase n=1 Tax=Penicillium hispanicum TaxID=1080232 RepID=UPI002540C085|nr:class V chitinase [Penicillium hispanicum]KAJ5569518.1 class V chitinase [Penicillium hispanicum]
MAYSPLKGLLALAVSLTGLAAATPSNDDFSTVICSEPSSCPFLSTQSSVATWVPTTVVLREGETATPISSTNGQAASHTSTTASSSDSTSSSAPIHENHMLLKRTPSTLQFHSSSRYVSSSGRTSHRSSQLACKASGSLANPLVASGQPHSSIPLHGTTSVPGSIITAAPSLSSPITGEGSSNVTSYSSEVVAFYPLFSSWSKDPTPAKATAAVNRLDTIIQDGKNLVKSLGGGSISCGSKKRNVAKRRGSALNAVMNVVCDTKNLDDTLLKAEKVGANDAEDLITAADGTFEKRLKPDVEALGDSISQTPTDKPSSTTRLNSASAHICSKHSYTRSYTPSMFRSSSSLSHAITPPHIRPTTMRSKSSSAIATITAYYQYDSSKNKGYCEVEGYPGSYQTMPSSTPDPEYGPCKWPTMPPTYIDAAVTAYTTYADGRIGKCTDAEPVDANANTNPVCQNPTSVTVISTDTAMAASYSASQSSAEAAAQASASAAAQMTANCTILYQDEFLSKSTVVDSYYYLGDIGSWATEKELSKQLDGCRGMEGWVWQDIGDGKHQAGVILEGNRPGCVERAIVSAGGPSIKCHNTGGKDWTAPEAAMYKAIRKADEPW